MELRIQIYLLKAKLALHEGRTAAALLYLAMADDLIAIRRCLIAVAMS